MNNNGLIFAVLFTIVITLLSLTSVTADQICDREQLVASTESGRFVVHDDGTVTDTATGLMWQQCLLGMRGIQCNEGSAVAASWADALSFSASTKINWQLAGHQDWRIPNIRELSSIIELQCGRPAINLDVFPNSDSSHVWSASPYRFYPHYSWFVDFDDGIYIYGDRQEQRKIRLVRDIK